MSRLLLAILLVSIGGTSLCLAKKLYKYQDPQGIWHFSDRPPAQQANVEVRQLTPSVKQRVKLEQSGDKNQPDFLATNRYPGPIEILVDWNKHDNAYSSPALPLRRVVESQQTANLFQVRSNSTNAASSFTLQYQYMIGRPLINYISVFPYAPPIAVGSRFQITQGFNGEFSHTDDQNRYAVDLMMPVDTPVYAARGGVVLEVNDDYYRSGTEQAYANKANSIRILHDDDSMAVYAHLALEKAQVSPGDHVNTGQLIAYSGNTGYTTGPHLHFAVQINRGMELVSVPFQFVDGENRAEEPQVGKWLGR